MEPHKLDNRVRYHVSNNPNIENNHMESWFKSRLRMTVPLVEQAWETLMAPHRAASLLHMVRLLCRITSKQSCLVFRNLCTSQGLWDLILSFLGLVMMVLEIVPWIAPFVILISVRGLRRVKILSGVSVFQLNIQNGQMKTWNQIAKGSKLERAIDPGLKIGNWSMIVWKSCGKLFQMGKK